MEKIVSFTSYEHVVERLVAVTGAMCFLVKLNLCLGVRSCNCNLVTRAPIEAGVRKVSLLWLIIWGNLGSNLPMKCSSINLTLLNK